MGHHYFHVVYPAPPCRIPCAIYGIRGSRRLVRHGSLHDLPGGYDGLVVSPGEMEEAEIGIDEKFEV